MDYSKYPPEVNGTRIAGPGEASMEAAAVAWDHLGHQLDRAAELISDVLDGLSETWAGEAATLMIAAATRYMDWLQDVSDAARNTARQLKHLARAYYETTGHMFPLQQIQANRARRAVLASDPAAALHAPEIAKLDIAYEGFWDLNATAMNNYAINATEFMRRLIPWPLAPYISKEAGLNLKGLPRYPRGHPRRFEQPVNYHA